MTLVLESYGKTPPQSMLFGRWIAACHEKGIRFDGRRIRRSLLAAKIAQMQAEDEKEAARETIRRHNGSAKPKTLKEVRPGWGALTGQEEPVSRSFFNQVLQRMVVANRQMQDDPQRV